MVLFKCKYAISTSFILRLANNKHIVYIVAPIVCVFISHVLASRKTFVGGRTLQSTSKGMEEKGEVKLYSPSTATPQAKSKQSTPQTTPGATPQATPTGNGNKEQHEEERDQAPVGKNR